MPAPYATRSAAPDQTVWLAAARVMIAPSVGPMHGVQPIATPAPRRNEPPSDVPWRQLPYPTIGCQPMTVAAPRPTIATPASGRSVGIASKAANPTSPRETQSATKTPANPSRNPAALARSPPPRPATRPPPTNAMKTGITGRTHGDRHDTSPPKNATASVTGSATETVRPESWRGRDRIDRAGARRIPSLGRPRRDRPSTGPAARVRDIGRPRRPARRGRSDT